jgi:putative ABC transport system permease protein
MLNAIYQDFRLGLKAIFRKNNHSLIIAIAAMALGIGAAVAIFSVVNIVLLQPLPYPDADRLVMVWNHYSQLNLPHLEVSEPELYDYRKQSNSLQSLAAIFVAQGNLTGVDEPERISLALVSPAFFPVLGVPPSHGRVFVNGEDTPASPRLAVLSDPFWRRRFGGDLKAIGSTLVVNANSYIVVGVMPPGFRYPEKVDIWAPLRLNQASPGGRGNHYLTALGRLKPGVGMRQAQAEMVTIGQRLQQEYPNAYTANSGWGVNLFPLQQELTGNIRPALLVVLAAVGLVLIIACANVANLQIERALERSREIALRTALGAARASLIRRFIAESLLVTFIGGAIGVLIASLALPAMTRIDPAALPRAYEITLNAQALLFAAALALLSGLVIGLVPAVQTLNLSLTEALQEGGEKSAGGRGRQRVRRLLVIAETAMALVLAIGSGLLARTFSNLQHVNPGFGTASTLTLQIALPGKKYPESRQLNAFYQQLLEGAAALPGVRYASVIDYLPLSGLEASNSYFVEDHPPAPGSQAPEADLRFASPDYFHAMAIPLKRGRIFGNQDSEEAPKVAMVDESFVRRMWPNGNPLGKRIKLGPGADVPWRTVVGVIGHVKNTSIDSDSREQIYLPFAQAPANSAFLVLRTDRDPLSLTVPVRNLVKKIDPEIPIFDAQPMAERFARSIASQRLSMALLITLAVLALFLAAIGMYSVIANSVTQRNREIGVRIALGAQRRDIFRMVVSEGLTMSLVGMAIGLAIAYWTTRLLANLLFGISATDLLTYLLTSLLLASTATAASYFPARRATKVSPMTALGRGSEE